MRTARTAYTLDGPNGRLLDAAEQTLALSDIQCFETEALMAQSGVVAPVLTYLFHRLEKRFDGRPTLLILDEAWIFLDHPLFVARIREWLKTLRKKDVAYPQSAKNVAPRWQKLPFSPDARIVLARPHHTSGVATLTVTNTL